MDEASTFLRTLRAVEDGMAAAGEARETACFAGLAREDRYRGLASHLLARRQRSGAEPSPPAGFPGHPG
jgi:hypothetical protein